MAEEHTQPIIVKKIKKGGHGHHGGAWKIAYADFVTAMMAFFLLMWLLSSTTKAERQAISDYFNNPAGVQGSGGSSTSVLKVGGGKDIASSAGETKDGSNAKSKDTETTPEKKAEVGEVTQVDKQRLLALKNEMEQAIDASDALRPFKEQILLEITKEGLRIQIVDKENRPMFASGSPVLQSYAAQLLKEIGKVINHVPNRISLSGHTDATPFSSFAGAEYSNWELSADRSNASRRALLAGGMDEGKVARVVGLSSAVLFDKQNPTNPVNRRISIIVLNKETEDAILHDEGKLEQTGAEGAAAPGAPAAVKAPAVVSKAPEKPVAAAAAVPPAAVPTVTKAAPAATTPAPVAPAKPPTITPITPPVAPALPAAAAKPTPAPAAASPTPATKPAPSSTTPPGGIAPVIAPLVGPLGPPAATVAPASKQ